MTHEFVEDPQKFLGVYQGRSLAKTSNSIDKTKFSWRMRKRLPWMKETASSLRRCLHSIRRYGYLGYMEPELIVPLPD